LSALTDIRRLDHGDVVAAIANAADRLLGVFPDEAGNICLLSGRASAGHDSRKLGSESHKFGPEAFQAELERLAVNDKAAIEFSGNEVEHVSDLVACSYCKCYDRVRGQIMTAKGLLTLCDLMYVLVPRHEFA